MLSFRRYQFFCPAKTSFFEKAVSRHFYFIKSPLEMVVFCKNVQKWFFFDQNFGLFSVSRPLFEKSDTYLFSFLRFCSIRARKKWCFFKKWKLTTFLTKNGISRALFEKSDLYLFSFSNFFSKMPEGEEIEVTFSKKCSRNAIFDQKSC